MKKFAVICLIILVISIISSCKNDLIQPGEKELKTPKATQPIIIHDVPDNIVINVGEEGARAYRDIRDIFVTKEEFLERYPIELPDIAADRIFYSFVQDGRGEYRDEASYVDVGGSVSYHVDTPDYIDVIANIFVSENSYDTYDCNIIFPDEEPQKSYINGTEMIISRYSDESEYSNSRKYSYDIKFINNGYFFTLSMNMKDISKAESENEVIDVLKDLTTRTAPPPEETKPTNPTEETKPTDPTDPIDKTNPTDPTLPPTEPTKPKDDAVVDDADDADTTTE